MQDLSIVKTAHQAKQQFATFLLIMRNGGCGRIDTFAIIFLQLITLLIIVEGITQT
jgi:hypothetical protein